MPLPKALPDWAREVKRLRDSLHLSQVEFAASLGVHQVVVSDWERGRKEPAGERYIQMGKMALPPDCWFFFEKAGLTRSDIYRLMPEVQAAVLDKIEEVRIARLEMRPANKADKKFRDASNKFVGLPLLADPAAAGSPRVVREGQIDSYIPVPADRVPHPLDTVCVKVAGDSMEPVLRQGYVVAVDTSERDPRRLAQKMVAVRERSGDEAGLTIKWLDRSGKDFILTPENKEYRPQLVTEDHEIVGRVIWWYGHQE